MNDWLTQSPVDLLTSGVWQTVLAGLNGLQSSLDQVAIALLILTFLLGVYEAFFQGGNLQSLAGTILKFGVAAAIVTHWTAFMGDVETSGQAISNAMLLGDRQTISNFTTSLQQFQSSPTSGSWFMLGASGTAMAIVSLLMITASLVVYYVVWILFIICFVFWGSILYCLGPLLISLAPSGITKGYTGTYAKALTEWALWPAFSSMFITIISALQLSSVTQLASTPNPSLGAAAGAQAVNLLLSIVSLVFAVCLIAIPFLAHHLIKGSFSGLAAVARQAAGVIGGGVSGGMSTAAVKPAATAGGSAAAAVAATRAGLQTAVNAGVNTARGAVGMKPLRGTTTPPERSSARDGNKSGGSPQQSGPGGGAVGSTAAQQGKMPVADSQAKAPRGFSDGKTNRPPKPA